MSVMPQAEEIVRAAVVDPYRNVFSIGPFGQRVSFVSQQKRALRLIWALHEAKLIDRGNTVAVIGGGLAGLTAAAALLARGCIVSLYEQEPDVFTMQSSASHRFLHPSVNFWPLSSHTSTTRLPFLEWHTGFCSEVVRELREEWKSKFFGSLSGPFLETTVLKITSGTTNSDPVKVFSHGAHSVKRGPLFDNNIAYDKVIVATGFGTERDLDNVKIRSYWDPDQINRERRKAANKLFVVSGSGDGGLLDTLRILHDQFDEGRLPLTLVSKLRGKPVEDKIRSVEKAVLRMRIPGDLDQTLKAISTALRDEYANIVQFLPQNIKDLLDGSLRRSGMVHLVGKLPSPFSMETAPVHKLMIAHVLSSPVNRDENIFKYEQAQAKYGNDGYVTLTPIGSTGASLRIRPDVYIARHGGDPPVTTILPDSNEDEIRNRQLWLEGQHEDLIVDPNFFVEGLDGSVTPHDPDSEGFIKDRWRLMLSFLNEHYGYAKEPTVKTNRGKSQLVINRSDTDPFRYNRIGGEDTSIFGTPVEFLPLKNVGTPGVGVER